MIKNVPELRFKGFTDEWKEAVIGDLYSFKNGLNKEKNAFGTGTPIINYMDVNKNVIIQKNDIQGRVEVTSSEKERFRVQPNDLFFTRTSETSDEIGLTCAYVGDESDLVFSGFILKATPKVQQVDSVFQAYYLRSFSKRKEIIKYSSITTRALISGSLLSQIPIKLPTLEEQKKISVLFKRLDDTISLQQQLVDQYQRYKRAMIQKMFPQKGERVPKLRFKGFNDEWKRYQLGDISDKVTEKNKGNVYSETFTNSAEHGIISQRDFFEKDISNKNNLDGYYIVRPGDFVYNPRISNLAPVGPIKRNNLGRTGVMSPLYYVFRVHDVVNKDFLEAYFSSTGWHKFMKLNGDTGARSDRFAIKDSVFRQMPIPLPSTEEQQKIGIFFKQLDDTIALHQKKLENYKQLKKALLQRMFV